MTKNDEEESDEERPSVNQIKYKAQGSSSSLPNSRPRLDILPFLKNLGKDIGRSLSPSNLMNMTIIIKKSFMILFVAKSTWSMGIFYLMVGLFFAMLSEITRGPKYNSIILVVLMVSISFSNFPKNSVRPQLVLTLLASLTLALDLQCLLRSPKLISPACKAFVSVSILAKFLALYDFLWFSDGSLRARKYLNRYDYAPTQLANYSQETKGILHSFHSPSSHYERDKISNSCSRVDSICKTSLSRRSNILVDRLLR
jgi:hypothetical protein